MRACNSSTNSHVNNNIGISIYHSANAIACTKDSFILMDFLLKYPSIISKETIPVCMKDIRNASGTCVVFHIIAELAVSANI